MAEQCEHEWFWSGTAGYRLEEAKLTPEEREELRALGKLIKEEY